MTRRNDEIIKEGLANKDRSSNATAPGNAGIRLECLRLAVIGREGRAPDEVLNAASAFSNFVLNGPSRTTYDMLQNLFGNDPGRHQKSLG